MRPDYTTRTITTTHATALCLDTVSAEPTNITVVLPHTYKDNATLLKAVKKAAETDTLVVCSIVNSTVCNELYGIPTNKFLEMAERLDPETRKPYENNAADETATSSN